MTSLLANAAIKSSDGKRADQFRPGSFATTIWTTYVLTLRQHVHGKRWLGMALLFLLPVALAVLVRTTAPDAPSLVLEFILAFMFIPQGVLPFVALLYASGILQDDEDEQTITYLLVRPLPKWALYVVKLAATISTTVVLTAIFTLLTYAAIYVGAESSVDNVPWRAVRAAAIHSLAVTAYSSLFGLLGLVTRRVLVVGVAYIAIVEGLLANLPFGIRLVTVIYYARLIAYRSLEFVVERPRGGTEDIAAIAWQFDLRRDPELLEHPQFTTCLLVLLVASLVCTVVASILCTQREFRVKTPGNA